MSHEKFEKMIDSYATALLRVDDNAEMEKHLSECDSCRESVAAVRELEGKIAVAAKVDCVPDGLVDKTIAALDKAGGKPALRLALPSISRKLRISFAAAALLLGFFMVGYLADGKSSFANDSAAAKHVAQSGLESAITRIEANPLAKGVSYFGDNAVDGSGLADWNDKKALPDWSKNPSLAAETDYGLAGTPRLNALGKSYSVTASSLGAYEGRGSHFQFDFKNHYNRATPWLSGGSFREDLGAVVHAATTYADHPPSSNTSAYDVWSSGARVERGSTIVNNWGEGERKIATNGQVEVEVESYEATYKKILDLVMQVKGYVQAATTARLPNGKIRGSIVVRIPPEKFVEVTDAIATLGTVKNKVVGSKDITKDYMDLAARINSKKVLEERLQKIVKEGKGEVKELLEVEKELARVREEIERLEGEQRYYDNITALASLEINAYEKEIEKPVEYIQTESAALTLVVEDVDAAYKAVQETVTAQKGRIMEANVTRQNESSSGKVRAAVDAEKFAALIDLLKSKGEVKHCAVEEKRTPSGSSTPAVDAPLRKEQGVIDVYINPVPGQFVQTAQASIVLENDKPSEVSARALELCKSTNATVVEANSADGRAEIRCMVDSDSFDKLVNDFKSLAKVTDAHVNRGQVAQGIDSTSKLSPRVVKQKALLTLTIQKPAALVPEEKGIASTLKTSATGLLSSLGFVIIGFAYAAPWLALVLVAYFLYRKLRKPATISKS